MHNTTYHALIELSIRWLPQAVLCVDHFYELVLQHHPVGVRRTLEAKPLDSITRDLLDPGKFKK